MVSEPRSFWQRVKKLLKITGIVLVCLLGVAFIVSFIGGYFFDWTWTGFGPYIPPTSGFQRGVTLYDWLQLAVVPAAIAFGVVGLSRSQQKRDQQLAQLQRDRDQQLEDQRAKSEQEAALKRAETERDIALDNQREAALQAYIDSMSELLLNGHLAERTAEGQLKPVDKQVRDVARVRTITVLVQLDARRVGYVFAFLREAELMSATKDDNAISLKNADLHAVNWSQADLRGADLRQANLSGAYLQRADLRQANLSGADLSGANLSDAIFFRTIYVPRAFGGTIILPNSANLSGADLSGANLSGAKFTDEQLAEVRSLEGATMPDGTKHA